MNFTVIVCYIVLNNGHIAISKLHRSDSYRSLTNNRAAMPVMAVFVFSPGESSKGGQEPFEKRGHCRDSASGLLGMTMDLKDI